MSLRTFFAIACSILLVACGANTDGSTVVSPSDAISSTATVRFNTATSLTVLKNGGDATSKVFEVCTLDMKEVAGDLDYALVDTNTLDFSTATYTYKRSLDVAKTQAGIPSRVFSVWGIPDRIVDDITLSFEVAVEPELLTFRLICKS